MQRNFDGEQPQVPLTSEGNEDEATKIRDSIYYTAPATHKPPVVQLRRGSRTKNNRYSKGCSDTMDQGITTLQSQTLVQENKNSMVMTTHPNKNVGDATSQPNMSPKNNKYSTQGQPNNAKSEIYLSSSF